MSQEGHWSEPVRGLPGRLPPGEHILWQGTPAWRRLALTAFHLRLVGVYFALLIGAAILAGAGWSGLLATLVAGMAAAAILAGLAYWSAKASIYTLTNRRIVLRIGAALPTCINVPLEIVRSVDAKFGPDGTADLALELSGDRRIGWALLWPHARPWHLHNPQPMLRAVPDGRVVAALLSRTLLDVHPDGIRRLPAPGPKPRPGAVPDPLPEARAA